MSVGTVRQCKSCPWRVDCVPDRDIPRYDEKLHRGLRRTIQSGIETLAARERHVMACHYSKDGAEIPCAGWMQNQLGPGNNIALRLAVSAGRMQVPEVDGAQHSTFDETLPRKHADKHLNRRGSMTTTRASRMIYAPNDIVFRQPGVEAFASDGFCAHAFAPVGESLIGWWPSEDDARRALLAYYRDYAVVQLSEHDPTIVAMYKASDGAGEPMSVVENWNRHIDKWKGKLSDVVFAGGFNCWAGIV